MFSLGAGILLFSPPGDADGVIVLNVLLWDHASIRFINTHWKAAFSSWIDELESILFVRRNTHASVRHVLKKLHSLFSLLL